MLEVLGAIFFVLGFIVWALAETPQNIDKELEYYSKKLEDRTYINCQSCGRRFTSVRKYGLEEDGNINYAFCQNCYSNGEFINKDLTVEEIIAQTIERNKKKPWFVKKIIINEVKNLERWL